jgi:hypothetical protein
MASGAASSAPWQEVALDDRPRPGGEPTITLVAKAWLVSLACRKAKDRGYPTNCGRHESEGQSRRNPDAIAWIPGSFATRPPA